MYSKENEIDDNYEAWTTSVERMHELNDKYKPNKEQNMLNLHKVVTEIIQDSHPSLKDYDIAEKHMHHYFLDRGHENIMTLFRDEFFYELEEDFLEFYYNFRSKHEMDALRMNFALGLISDATNKLEQLENLNDGEMLLKDLEGDKFVNTILREEKDKNDMVQMLFDYLNKFYVAKMNYIDSENRITIVNLELDQTKGDLKTSKEICYDKDTDILHLMKELEPYRPQKNDWLINQENFIDLLDFVKKIQTSDSRKTKEGKKKKLTPKYILGQFEGKHSGRKGCWKSWDTFLREYSKTIKLITGEVFTTKVDSLFAIEKHRDKVDKLFDVHKKSIKTV